MHGLNPFWFYEHLSYNKQWWYIILGILALFHKHFKYELWKAKFCKNYVFIYLKLIFDWCYKICKAILLLFKENFNINNKFFM